MEIHDSQLERFAAQGAHPLPEPDAQGRVQNAGAQIWFACYGAGRPVILLHGGLGHSGNWGYQVPALIQSGYQVTVIDSRGHGRSTRDERPYSYELMASDVLAVMNHLNSDRASLVGWSDGACTALTLTAIAAERVECVFFFACNMDPSGTKPMEASPALDRCFARHRKDYERLSSTPDRFESFVEAVSLMMRTQPNFSSDDLSTIQTPVAIVQSPADEFIRMEHAKYLADTLPNAILVPLQGVSHFAPLQAPSLFNSVLLEYLSACA